MRMAVVLVFHLGWLWSTALAFAPLSRPTKTTFRKPTTRRFLMPDLWPDPSSLQQHLLDAQTHIEIWSTGATNIAPPSVSLDSSFFLSDAAEVTTEASTGWWSQYLNIFKTVLEIVHSTIDPPLRSAGVQQTWGISIALFTVSKLK
jgi:hypothetical protein